MELNKKQILFCEEYIIDLNGKQAAIRAGYSAKTAEVQASRLLSLAKVAGKITELQKVRSERTGITADKVITELFRIAFTPTTDFIKIDDIERGSGKRKRTIRAAVAELTKNISQDKLSAIAEIKQTQHGISIKLHDKVRALELLGKHLGLFKELHEHTGKEGKPIELNVKTITHNLVVKRCDK